MALTFYTPESFFVPRLRSLFQEVLTIKILESYQEVLKHNKNFLCFLIHNHQDPLNQQSVHRQNHWIIILFVGKFLLSPFE